MVTMYTRLQLATRFSGSGEVITAQCENMHILLFIKQKSVEQQYTHRVCSAEYVIVVAAFDGPTVMVTDAKL